MKKIYLSLLASFLCTAAFSQGKAAFGIVFSAGNFTAPFNTTSSEHSPYDQWVSTTIKQQGAGSNFGFGIKETIRINDQTSISGELLYRLASYSTSVTYANAPIGADPLSRFNRQDQQVQESSIAIPIKLQVSFKPNGRTSLALGAGVSRRLGTEFKGRSEYKDMQFPNSDYSYQYPDLNVGMREFSPQLLLSAGLFHRIDKNTALGLEFNYERRAAEDRRYSSGYPFYIDQVSFCQCYGFLFLETPSLRSFSLSLSHNFSK